MVWNDMLCHQSAMFSFPHGILTPHTTYKHAMLHVLSIQQQPALSSIFSIAFVCMLVCNTAS